MNPRLMHHLYHRAQVTIMLELPELEALIAKRDRVADRLGARVSVTTPTRDYGTNQNPN